MDTSAVNACIWLSLNVKYDEKLKKLKNIIIQFVEELARYKEGALTYSTGEGGKCPVKYWKAWLLCAKYVINVCREHSGAVCIICYNNYE